MQSINIDVLVLEDMNNKFDEVRVHLKVKLFRDFTTPNWEPAKSSECRKFIG